MSKISKKIGEMSEDFLITRYKILEGHMKEFMEANNISEADFKLHGSAHEYMQQHTTNIEWSEYEHKIWCYDCLKDLPGTPGIFDGPIPLGTMEILGAPLWRIYLKSQAVCKPVITKAGKVVYRKMKKSKESKQ